ncbi:hypothetical protein V6N13_095541 [Hibiscus sabdariffa]
MMLSFSNQLDAAGETVRGMAHDTPQTVNMGSNKTSLTQPEVQVTNIVADGMVEDTNAGESGIERNLLVIVHFILYMMTAMASPDGDWLWNKFQDVLPSHACLSIAEIKGPIDAIAEDSIAWTVPQATTG